MSRPFSSMMIIGTVAAAVTFWLFHINAPRQVIAAYLVFNAWQIAANVINEIVGAIRGLPK